MFAGLKRRTMGKDGVDVYTQGEFYRPFSLQPFADFDTSHRCRVYQHYCPHLLLLLGLCLRPSGTTGLHPHRRHNLPCRIINPDIHA